MPIYSQRNILFFNITYYYNKTFFWNNYITLMKISSNIILHTVKFLINYTTAIRANKNCWKNLYKMLSFCNNLAIKYSAFSKNVRYKKFMCCDCGRRKGFFKRCFYSCLHKNRKTNKNRNPDWKPQL